jgi:hypothetical protein
MPPLHEGTI